MPNIEWTETQYRRLRELGTWADELDARFEDAISRDDAFQRIEKTGVRKARQRLRHFLSSDLRPQLCCMETRLVEALTQLGFSQVVTPTIMSKAHLAKMGIGPDHPLAKQVYWINDRQCLRPMLAPNLYQLMIALGRVAERPIRFFEVGTCFRKESDGAIHNSEFTMLNLVEMGIPEDARTDRLLALGRSMLNAAGISDYRFETEESEVYGDTIDIVHGKTGVELASGAIGPHPLDVAWRITDTWVGLGFGLERLVMVCQGDESLGRWGKSLAYLDGIRLNL